MPEFKTLEEGVHFYVAHGMEKSMSLRDPGGWPDLDEVTHAVDCMSRTDFLRLLSMVHEELMEGRLLEGIA